MTVTTRGAEDESPSVGAVPAVEAAADRGESLVGTLGTQVATDQCATCGAALAPDQRYCVECGTRRGRPRFTLPPATQPEPADAATTPATRRARWSPSATLLAGIATLLLALGVGVLIGRAGSSTPRAGGTHITINGAGGSSGAATNTPSSTAGQSSTSTRSSSSKAKSKTSGKAASKSTKSTNTPPPSSGVSPSVTKTPTVKPGGTCTAGTPGCQGGKETGNFFGS